MFSSRLGEVGAEFPEWFVKQLDRLIISMHPKYRKKAEKAKALARKQEADGTNGTNGDGEDKNLRARKFPGLSLPDKELAILSKDDPSVGKEITALLPQVDVNDTMSELAAVALRRSRPTAEDYLDGEPSSKRSRQSEGGMAGPSRLNGNGYTSVPVQNGYSSRDHVRARPSLDYQPVLYKIYDGTVQNIRDFGAFVSLEGIQGRVEGEHGRAWPFANPSGMVHVSSITGTRIQSPSEIVKRWDKVKVKVMSVAGNKIGLSMRDVDQRTGVDLS